MTQYEALSLIVAILGYITVVASLLFVAKQTKTISESLHVDTLENIVSPIFDLSKMFIEYPEARPYFYLGKDISKEDPNYGRVKAICELFLDMFDYFLVNKRLFLLSYEQDRDRWEVWMLDMFASSPILRATYLEMKDWYPEELKVIYEKSLHMTDRRD